MAAADRTSNLSIYCFNLGIENLFFSSSDLIGIRSLKSCFNLGIENLFFSSGNRGSNRMGSRDPVSISESRIFSFQADAEAAGIIEAYVVSISESRIFSFQVENKRSHQPAVEGFQSRNRESFLFKGISLGFPLSTRLSVSISESRIFSFQEERCAGNQ